MKNKNQDTLVFWNLARKYLHMYLVHVTDRSPETIKAYKLSIENYIEFINFKYQIDKKDISFDSFSRDKYEEFIIWLKENKKLCNKSINLKTTAIRSFLKFAGEEDIELMKFYLEIYPIRTLKVQKNQLNI